MRLGAALIFLAGVASGFDLTMWATGDHCMWPLTCIHLWHHVIFTAAYVFVAFCAYTRLCKERG